MYLKLKNPQENQSVAGLILAQRRDNQSNADVKEHTFFNLFIIFIYFYFYLQIFYKPIDM